MYTYIHTHIYTYEHTNTPRTHTHLSLNIWAGNTFPKSAYYWISYVKWIQNWLVRDFHQCIDIFPWGYGKHSVFIWQKTKRQFLKNKCQQWKVSSAVIVHSKSVNIYMYICTYTYRCEYIYIFIFSVYWHLLLRLWRAWCSWLAKNSLKI